MRTGRRNEAQLEWRAHWKGQDRPGSPARLLLEALQVGSDYAGQWCANGYVKRSSDEAWGEGIGDTVA